MTHKRKERGLPADHKDGRARLVLAVNAVRTRALLTSIASLLLCVLVALWASRGTNNAALGAAIFLALAIPYLVYFVAFFVGCRRRASELEGYVVRSGIGIESGRLTHTTTYMPTGSAALDDHLRSYAFARAHAGANIACLVVFSLMLLGLIFLR